jgi:hypothetical protein
MNKVICFTIDVEPDFGGLLDEDMYFGIDNLKRLIEIVRKYNIKITAFVTGKTVEDRPIVIDLLQEIDAEIEQHSYNHQVGHGSKLKDIEKGIESYEKTFGKPPNGYRAPQGIITKEEISFLQHAGVKYDSSIFPTFFPGRFNRLGFPTNPFYLGHSKLVEIPFSVLPRIRIPISLSYMQLIGFNNFKFLFKIFGLHSPIIYDFHTYELGKVKSYQQLPLNPKIGYFRSQNLYHDPATVFESFIGFILREGYQSRYMMELYDEVKPSLTSWSWADC